MISFTVKLDEDITLKTDALRDGFNRGRHRTAIARAAANVVKENFRKLSSQRHKGGSFNFYGRARQATHYSGVNEKIAYVSIDHEGIALRRFGGTVRPRKGKYLTIPAIDEAEGKRAREFSDLHFQRNSKGGGSLSDSAGRVFYWLVKSTTHKADPSVLPTDSEIQTAAATALKAWVELTESRG